MATIAELLAKATQTISEPYNQANTTSYAKPLEFSNTQVKDYIANLQKTNPDDWASKTYDAAKKYGVTADQVDAAMSWDSGTSQKYITDTQRSNLAATQDYLKPSATANNAYSGDAMADVSQMYRDTFGREADDDGLKYWTNYLNDGTYNLDQVQTLFNASPEMVARNSYQSLLGREGDEEGIGYYTSQAQKGLLNVDNIESTIAQGLVDQGYTKGADGQYRYADLGGTDGITSPEELRAEYNRVKEERGYSTDQMNHMLYDMAKTNGLSTALIDDAFGLEAGEAEKWVQDRSFDNLVGGYDKEVATYSPKIAADVQKFTNIGQTKSEKFAMAYTAAALSNATVQDVSDATGLTEDEVRQLIVAADLDTLEERKRMKEMDIARSADSGWRNQYRDAGREINPETDTVQGQLNSLLAFDSPLMQRAYYKGLDMANSRGLLNSSMAGEAAQAAMMDKALQIAGPDAEAYLKQGMVNQGYENEFNLNDRNYLQQQERDAILQRYRKDNAHLDTDLAMYRDEAQQGYRQDNARLDNDLAMERDAVNNKFDNDNLAATTAANTQGLYLKSIDTLFSDAAGRIAKLEATPGLSAEELAQGRANIIAQRDIDADFLRRLYSDMPTWDMSWIDLDEMPGAPGVEVTYEEETA